MAFADEKTVPALHTLDDMVKELHNVFSEDRINVEYVKAVLSSYKSNPKDWRKYAKFDQHRYTRNLIDAGNGKFNLMALCWGEQHGSSIHDHSNAHCFVKVLDGALKESMFAWPSESEQDQQMDTSDVNVYQKDEVAYINDSMGLHRMENPSHTEPAVTLHLYVPPFESCKTFDQRTGHQREAKVTFWSKYGERTKFSAGANQCAALPSSSDTVVCTANDAHPEDN